MFNLKQAQLEGAEILESIAQTFALNIKLNSSSLPVAGTELRKVSPIAYSITAKISRHLIGGIVSRFEQ